MILLVFILLLSSCGNDQDYLCHTIRKCEVTCSQVDGEPSCITTCDEKELCEKIFHEDKTTEEGV